MAIRLIAILLLSHLMGVAVHAQDVKTGKFEYLKGKVGDYPVTMTLCIGADADHASYYYDRFQRPIALFSQRDSSTHIRLASGDEELTMDPTPMRYKEELKVDPMQDGYKGVLKLGEKGKSFSVELKNVASPVNLMVYSISLKRNPTQDLDKGPFFSYVRSIVWPVGDAPRQQFIARSIWKLLEVKDGNHASIQEYLRVSARRELSDFEAEVKKASAKELKEAPAGFSSEDEWQVFVSYLTSDFLSLSLWDYGYTGGAHGGSGESFMNLDLKNLRVWGFDDVFVERAKLALTGPLEKALRADKGLKPDQKLSDNGLFEDHIKEASQSILVTGKGVIFHYGQYEIAPYSEGMIDIFLSWSELKPYLTPSFSRCLAEGL